MVQIILITLTNIYLDLSKLNNSFIRLSENEFKKSHYIYCETNIIQLFYNLNQFFKVSLNNLLQMKFTLKNYYKLKKISGPIFKTI